MICSEIKYRGPPINPNCVGGGGKFSSPPTFKFFGFIWANYAPKVCEFDYLSRKNVMGSWGFHSQFKMQRKVCGWQTRKSRVSAIKTKILRKTEHISKIVLYTYHFLTIRPNLATGSGKDKKGHIHCVLATRQYTRGILLFFGTWICCRWPLMQGC